MVKNLRKEIGHIKWPKKDKVIKDIVVVVATSTILMLLISAVSFASQYITSFIY